MYNLTGPEMLAHLKVKDYLRDAERLHQVSAALKERKAAREGRPSVALAPFRKGFATLVAALHSLAA